MTEEKTDMNINRTNKDNYKKTKQKLNSTSTTKTKKQWYIMNTWKALLKLANTKKTELQSIKE